MIVLACVLFSLAVFFWLVIILDVDDLVTLYCGLIIFLALGLMLGVLVTGGVCSVKEAETTPVRYEIQELNFSPNIFLERLGSENGSMFMYKVGGEEKIITGKNAEVSIVTDGQNFLEVITTHKPTLHGECDYLDDTEYIFHISGEGFYSVPK